MKITVLIAVLTMIVSACTPSQGPTSTEIPTATQKVFMPTPALITAETETPTSTFFPTPTLANTPTPDIGNAASAAMQCDNFLREEMGVPLRAPRLSQFDWYYYDVFHAPGEGVWEVDFSIPYTSANGAKGNAALMCKLAYQSGEYKLLELLYPEEMDYPLPTPTLTPAPITVLGGKSEALGSCAAYVYDYLTGGPVMDKEITREPVDAFSIKWPDDRPYTSVYDADKGVWNVFWRVVYKNESGVEFNESWYCSVSYHIDIPYDYSRLERLVVGDEKVYP